VKICFELYKFFSNQELAGAHMEILYKFFSDQELAGAHMEILEADYKPWDISKGGMMI